MKKHTPKNRKRWCIGLAVYQITGALVILTLIFLFIKDNISPAVIFGLVPIFAISLVSLMAGVLFFFKGNEVRFFTLSKLNFCFQLLQLSIPPGFTFFFYYGPYLGIGFDGDFHFMQEFKLFTSSFAFEIGGTDAHYVLFNFAPLLLLLKLRSIERSPVATPELENAFIEGS